MNTACRVRQPTLRPRPRPNQMNLKFMLRIAADAIFPLTLTLSPEERKQRSAACKSFNDSRYADRLAMILPLPKPYRFSWNSRSPSPQPSPPRRGRSFSSAGECSPFGDFPRTTLAGSLSWGRGSRVRASLTANCRVRAEGKSRGEGKRTRHCRDGISVHWVFKIKN